MNNDRRLRIEKLFHESLNLDPKERRAFLDEECSGDPSLRSEVEKLLAADGSTHGLLESVQNDASILAIEIEAGQALPTIDRYKLLHKIGEGGFGEVYSAEQIRPLRRIVALKLLKAGMDTKAVLARFDAERQALALMDHPSIATVHDAGETDRGRPYFVMELVEGNSITAYCDKQKLSLRARLELFRSVCRAVQHAHQKGVIHRDLKPSNILVADAEGQPLPKIIDFGIAKATRASISDATLTTAGQLIGTPQYMSPEQAGQGGEDIDTRSDIYSLGVVLYEMLTGSLPLDPDTLRTGGVAEIQQIIRDTDPQRPSTKVSGQREQSAEFAAKRSTDVRTLVRRLRGDLDWIVLKSLEKERGRRYETADALALDIERYLNDEPVLAGRPSTAYRLRKAAKRNRVPILVTSFVIASLAVALVMSNQERAKAERSRDESEAVTGFLVQMLGAVDPGAEGRETTVREVLEKAADGVETELADRPIIRARLMATMGSVYRSLGHFDKSRPLLEGALGLRTEAFGEQHQLVAETQALLGLLLFDTGDYEESRRAYESALATREDIFGPEHTAVASTASGLAAVHWKMGNFAEAEEYYERCIRITREQLGSDDPTLASALTGLAIVLDKTGKYERSGELHEEAIRITAKAKGARHLDVAYATNNLAIIRKHMGNYEEATELYKLARSIWEENLGPDHPLVASAISNLAILLRDTGDLEGARPLLEQALAMRESTLGPDHADVASSLNTLARLHLALDDVDTALPLFERALAIWEQSLGANHPSVALSLEQLAGIKQEQGDWGAARSLLERTLSIREAAFGPNHDIVAISLHNLANLDRDTNQFERAEERYLAAEVIFQATFGAVNAYSAENLSQYAQLLRLMERNADAEEVEARAAAAAGTAS